METVLSKNVMKNKTFGFIEPISRRRTLSDQFDILSNNWGNMPPNYQESLGMLQINKFMKPPLLRFRGGPAGPQKYGNSDQPYHGAREDKSLGAKCQKFYP